MSEEIVNDLGREAVEAGIPKEVSGRLIYLGMLFKQNHPEMLDTDITEIIRDAFTIYDADPTKEELKIHDADFYKTVDDCFTFAVSRHEGTNYYN